MVLVKIVFPKDEGQWGLDKYRNNILYNYLFTFVVTGSYYLGNMCWDI